MPDRSPSLRIVLELDRGSQPINGTVADPDGHRRRFVGWLAFIGAVEEMRSALTPADPKRSSVQDGAG